MKGKAGDKQRLLHIAEAINEIEAYTAGQHFDTFLTNSMMRFASVKQIEIIGEAANLLSDETKELAPSIPWKQIIGLRHILVHEYFGIDSNLIWQIIEQDLPLLKSELTGLLEKVQLD